jgi:DNA modification methylase
MIYHETDHGILFQGDCLDIMRSLPDNSVDAVVTDPPYGLSFMGKKWDYAVPSVEIWAECLRVLKPGGYLLSFAGTRTQHRIACGIEDAGFEIRDMIAWVYGSGFPKSLNVGNGYGTALKPALEPITVARKPIDGTVAQNVLKWGTGAIDIDGCRVDSTDGVPQFSKDNKRPGTTFDVGSKRTGEISKQGRFPANLIHDGSDEVLECFPNDAARFFYCAKASRSERNAGLDGMEERIKVWNGQSNKSSSDIKPVEERWTTKMQNTHPTVKPIALMEYLIKLVAREGQTVLDPFLGSGTTAIACVKQGRKYIGCEMDKDYCEIAKRRIESEIDQNTIDL